MREITRAAADRMNLEPRERAVLHVLIEVDNGLVSSGELLSRANSRLGELAMADTRAIRRIINHLITHHDIPVNCKPGLGGGYGLMRDEEEVDAFYRGFRRRAMTGLVKAARGRRSALVEMIEQLSLFELNDATATPPRDHRGGRERDDIPAFVQVVTRLLDRMAGDPDRYAAQIAEIQDRYGDIFLPRARVQRIRNLSEKLIRELQNMA